MKNNSLGYLTASMVQAYDCPKKYYYEYVEGWKAIRPSANMVFGSVVHESLAEEFLNGHTAQEVFLEKWEKTGDLIYSRSDTQESFRKTGLLLIEKVAKTEVYQRVVAVEKAYQTELADGTIFKGKIDLIYDDGKGNVVLDWKTANGFFQDSRPDLDDQLTAYSMLSGIGRVGYGILLKKKEPEVNFVFAVRNTEDYLDYQVKVMKTVADIESGFFYKKPSLYCGFCSFCPICRNQKEEIAATLTKRPVEDRYRGLECEEVSLD
ncbi:MAG: PD-(D/E)XK nuclease family protein [Candidatus Omnitrophota bacterium]